MCNFTHMKTTPAALPVPPLTEEQKAELKELAELTPLLNEPWASAYLGHYADYALATGPAVILSLLAENARLSHLLEEERRTGGELRGKVTSLLEDLANGCEPAVAGLMSDASEEWKAINRERANNLRFLELKTKELGIDWPIKPIPYKGNLPAPTCQRDCQKCESGKPGWQGVFATEADYDASVTDVVARIKSGQIKARTPQDSDEEVGGAAGVGLQGEEGKGVAEPFTGCWGNSSCPCNPPDLNDCPCYIAPEPE